MEQQTQDRWRHRRRIVYGSLSFCFAVIGYIVATKWDSPTAQGIVMYLSALAGSVIGSYVFGAVWDDKPSKH